jgi:carboxyl-terminal processing protease
VTARITKGAIPERPRPAVEFSGIAGTPLITIHSFDEPEFEDKAIAYINEHREAPALVIDIRGNGGGNTPEKLTNTLMNTPYPTWREASAFRLGVDVAIEQLHSSRPVRSDERPRFTLSWTSSLVQPEGNCYQGKIFILHDIGTKSAAEDFLMPFKATGRATLIGETTCGSSGQPYIDHPFVDATFAIGAKRQLFPNGDRFEGIGIVPDVYVSSDRSHLHAGVDGVLQELEKIL